MNWESSIQLIIRNSNHGKTIGANDLFIFFSFFSLFFPNLILFFRPVETINCIQRPCHWSCRFERNINKCAKQIKWTNERTNVFHNKIKYFIDSSHMIQLFSFENWNWFLHACKMCMNCTLYNTPDRIASIHSVPINNSMKLNFVGNWISISNANRSHSIS